MRRARATAERFPGVVALALTVAWSAAAWFSAAPYRLVPTDDTRALEQVRAALPDRMPFQPVTRLTLRALGALSSLLGEGPSALLGGTVACLAATVLLLGAVTFRATASRAAAFGAMALFATSGWTATYLHWWSYAPVTALAGLAAFAALVEATRARERSPTWAALGGSATALVAGTSVSASVLAGLLAVGMLALGLASSSRVRRAVPRVSVATFVGGAGLTAALLANPAAWIAHVRENVGSPHLSAAMARFGAVPRPPALAGLWILGTHAPAVLVALVLATVAAAGAWRRAGIGAIPFALRAALAMVWAHLAVIDALPTTKLARAHFATFPLVCFAVAAAAHALPRWFPSIAARTWRVVVGVLATIAVVHGIARARETSQRRHAVPDLLATTYAGRALVLLEDDPHARALETWLGADREVRVVSAVGLASLRARPATFVLLLGPRGFGSGRSILGGGTYPDFAPSAELADALRTASLRRAPYYAQHPAFLLEEEICQGLLWSGRVPGGEAGDALLAVWSDAR